MQAYSVLWLTAGLSALGLSGCGGGDVTTPAPSATLETTSGQIAAETTANPSAYATGQPSPQSFTATAPSITLTRASNVAIPQVYFGMHFHRINGQTAWPDATIGSWRLWDADVCWRDLETSRGTWAWTKLDGYVAVAAKRGVQLTLPLGLSPRWASARPNETSSYGLGNAAEPASIVDWRNYVRTVATRYKGKIFFYEVWNEVNETGFFSGTQDKLVELTREARAVLKEVDPRIKLAGPSTVGSHAGAYTYFDGLLAKGIHNHVDALAYHLYVHRSGPEAVIDVVSNVRSRMAARNITAPLWNTETGWWIENQDGTPGEWDSADWKHLDQKLAAGYVIRSFVLGWVLGIEHYFWYSWDNVTMGLVEPTRRTMKLAGVAYKNMTTMFNGARISDCSLTDPIWTCNVTTKTGKAGKLMWSQADADSMVAMPAAWTTGTSIYYLEQSTTPLPFNQAQIRAGAVPRLVVKN